MHANTYLYSHTCWILCMHSLACLFLQNRAPSRGSDVFVVDATLLHTCVECWYSSTRYTSTFTQSIFRFGGFSKSGGHCHCPLECRGTHCTPPSSLWVWHVLLWWLFDVQELVSETGKGKAGGCKFICSRKCPRKRLALTGWPLQQGCREQIHQNSYRTYAQKHCTHTHTPMHTPQRIWPCLPPLSWAVESPSLLCLPPSPPTPPCPVHWPWEDE